MIRPRQEYGRLRIPSLVDRVVQYEKAFTVGNEGNILHIAWAYAMNEALSRGKPEKNTM